MKLNFWQILGMVLIVLGIAGIIFLKEEKPAPKPIPATAPATVGA